mmetsp:Transcript_82343/g.228476  ORF Transcript_82343/g.228476 Transcript_82343/m.228476 type:complete len:430 (+) Transcript_82343:92-1381(+)
MAGGMRRCLRPLLRDIGAGRRALAAAAGEGPVLVMNAGSSSFKFAVLPEGSTGSTFTGQVEQLESKNCRLLLKGQEPEALPEATLKDAVRTVLGRLPGAGSSLVGVGHRIVHGGMNLFRPTRISNEVLEEIRKVVPLAPLHNPSGIAAVEAAMDALPKLRDRHVACFDTGFHHGMLPEAQMYAIPKDIAEKLSIRRYGFHGISCESGYRRGCEALHQRADSERTRIILMHLGAGCSATAIIGGRSVDTTMGMTPLDGLMMGTRSGSVDPGIEKYMCDALSLGINEVEAILNKKSGLLGVSGISADMRTVLEGETSGTPEQQEACKQATQLWVYRLSKVIASMFIPLQHVTGLIFTGGIGENSAVIRARVLQQFAYRGVRIDEALNAAHGDQFGVITSRLSTIPAVVVRADEEAEIARATRTLLEGGAVA